MSETRIRPITRAALQKAGYLYADTVQEAFGKYEGGILSAQTREDMREFLREVERQNQGAMYGDFYYPVLGKEQKEAFLAGLSPDQRRTLETLDVEAGEIYFPVSGEVLDLLFEITASEWLFSSFYGGRRKVLIWGNYGLQFPIFCEDEETMGFYRELAGNYRVRWSK